MNPSHLNAKHASRVRPHSLPTKAITVIVASLLSAIGFAQNQSPGTAPIAQPLAAVAPATDPPPVPALLEPPRDDVRGALDMRLALATREPPDAVALIDELASSAMLDLQWSPGGYALPPDYSVRIGQSVWTPEEGIEQVVVELAAKLLADDQQALKDYPAKQLPLLLQFTRSPTWGEVRHLLSLGVLGIVNEIGPSTLLVLAPATSVHSLAAMPVIRSLSLYPSAVKLVVPHDGIDLARVWAIDFDNAAHRVDLQRLGARLVAYEPTIRAYVVRSTEGQAREIARLAWVRYVSFEGRQQIAQNFEPDDSRELCSVAVVPGWPQGNAGAGVTIGVLDTGVDDTHLDDFPPGTFRGGVTGPRDASHGTHVCGIVASRGTRPVQGEYNCRGMAPGSTLCVMRLNTALNDYGASLAHAEFQRVGARVSNHSWRYLAGPFAYDANTQAIDGYIDNGHQWVQAAGNSGSDTNTITNPATGKNVVSVGAISYVTDPQDGSELIGAVTNYSSRGPTRTNGRLKPEIMAPGGNHRYTAGHNRYDYGVVSSTAANWTVAEWSGTRNRVEEYPEWPEDDHYLRDSGTSMAAPHVTGALGLMLAAMPTARTEDAKALLIGTTVPLDKDSGDDPRSGYANTNAGFGLLNAFGASGWSYVGEEQQLVWVRGKVDWIFRSAEHVFSVPAGAQSIVLVMAYNDHAGNDTGATIDDLNLSVQPPTGPPISYVEPDGCPSEGTIEKVIVENPGQYGQGNWKALVAFKDPAWPWSNQDYTILVRARLRTPQLSVAAQMPKSVFFPGEDFVLPVSVSNAGGWVAAGVYVWTDGGGLGGEDAGRRRFVGNLMYRGHVLARNLTLKAPNAVGRYTFVVRADGVNRGLAEQATGQLTFDVKVPANYPPSGSNPQVVPPSGPYSTPFDYSIDVSDPERDSVSVTLDVFDPSSKVWEGQGSVIINGAGKALWKARKPFEADDAGMMAQYRFGYNDGHNVGTWGPYSGPTLEASGSNFSNWSFPPTIRPDEPIPVKVTISDNLGIISAILRYDYGNNGSIEGEIPMVLCAGDSPDDEKFFDAGNTPQGVGAVAQEEQRGSSSNVAPADDLLVQVSRDASTGLMAVQAGRLRPIAEGPTGELFTITCRLGTGHDPQWNITGERYVFGWSNSVHFGIEYRNVYEPETPRTVGHGWYRPDGSAYYENKARSTLPKPPPGQYWEWYRFVYWYDTMPDGMKAVPGLWQAKAYDNGNESCAKSFTVAYLFADHKLCADVQSSPPYDPIDVRNWYVDTDTQVYSWLKLDNLTFGARLMWRWYEPGGALHHEGTYRCDPPPGNWWPWYKAWYGLNIRGYYPATHPGKWSVHGYVEDYRGAWEEKFVEEFVIGAKAGCWSATIPAPGQPYAGQQVSFDVVARNTANKESVSQKQIVNVGQGNRPPVGSNPKVTPASGTAYDAFTYALDVYDPDADTVTVTLETFDPSSGIWEQQGSRQVFGSGMAKWDGLHPFEEDDEGRLAQFRFKMDDGKVAPIYGPVSGPSIVDEDVDPPEFLNWQYSTVCNPCLDIRVSVDVKDPSGVTDVNIFYDYGKKGIYTGPVAMRRVGQVGEHTWRYEYDIPAPGSEYAGLPVGFYVEATDLDNSPAKGRSVLQTVTLKGLPTVSGKVTSCNKAAIGEVRISASAGGGSSKTDPSGQYQVSVPCGWSGSITACKDGWQFNPSEYRYENVRDPRTGADFVGILIYDLAPAGCGNDYVDPGDLALFAKSWLQTVPPGDKLHDFDCDGFVGPGDLSYFATAWLKSVFDNTIKFPPCRLCGPSAGREESIRLAVRAIAVASPTLLDEVWELPKAVTRCAIGQSYYLEIWSRDVSQTANGITGIYVDIGTAAELAGIESVSPSRPFSAFATGQIMDDGWIDELGGATLEANAGGNGAWARIAIAKVKAAAAGRAEYLVRESSTGCAAFGRGVVPWPQVELEGTWVDHVVPADVRGNP